MNKEFFAGRKVLVMGLGQFGGGVDATKFACSLSSKVIVTDLASAEQLSKSIEELKEFSNIEFHLGGHQPADFKQADIIIASSAVEPDNKFLYLARENNKFVTSQINIFFELCRAVIIGITGANGKSSTAALTAHLLKSQIGKKTKPKTPYAWPAQYNHVWLSGNIGNQPLLANIHKIEDGDLVVLELSSFQTEGLAQIRKTPRVALLTNLTPNHLDRHGSFADYCTAKENIFKFQNLDPSRPAVSIFNAEDPVGCRWFDKYKHENGRVCIKFSVDDLSKEIRDSSPLPGKANLSNLAAAVSIARLFGIRDEQIKKTLTEFKPLPHRLEFVARINGVSWYNDSNATTPASAIAALEAFEEPKIIIAGGYDKNLAFDKLGEKIALHAKAAILIGQTAEKIADSINPESKTKIEITDSLENAVNIASRLAVEGDIILLSPACASYDMFENFQHRGRQFIKLVRESCPKR
jgi:UDP-N-acetylmuramoylalanine--D-glutamate ligase